MRSNTTFFPSRDMVPALSKSLLPVITQLFVDSLINHHWELILSKIYTAVANLERDFIISRESMERWRDHWGLESWDGERVQPTLHPPPSRMLDYARFSADPEAGPSRSPDYWRFHGYGERGPREEPPRGRQRARDEVVQQQQWYEDHLSPEHEFCHFQPSTSASSPRQWNEPTTAEHAQLPEMSGDDEQACISSSADRHTGHSSPPANPKQPSVIAEGNAAAVAMEKPCVNVREVYEALFMAEVQRFVVRNPVAFNTVAELPVQTSSPQTLHDVRSEQSCE